jgi:RNA polymerase sigma factor (sigma-70 family)
MISPPWPIPLLGVQVRDPGMGEAVTVDQSVRLEELYLRCWGRTVAICRRYLGNLQDAEDAAQETFTRVAKHLDRLDDGAPAYVYAVARSVCVDELRRRRRAASATAKVELAAPVAPDSVAADRGLLAALRQRLCARDRKLLLYRDWGYSAREIALGTGTSVNAIEVALCRARSRARLVLAT